MYKKSRMIYGLMSIAFMGALAGCVKEEAVADAGTVADGVIPADALELVAQQADAPESKVDVSGRNVYWSQNEPVRVNNQDLTIKVVSSLAQGLRTVNAYIENISSVTPEGGLYFVSTPRNLIVSKQPTGSRPTNTSATYALSVTGPSQYTYKMSGNYQKIDGMPMFGMTNVGSSQVNMEYLAAAVSVNCTNSARLPIMLDKIEIIVTGSNNVSGRGNFVVDYNPRRGCINTVTHVANTSSTTILLNDKKVTMTFPQTTAEEKAAATIAAGGQKAVQVPILPIGSGSRMTVKVYFHVDWDGAIAADPQVAAWKRASYVDGEELFVSQQTSTTGSVYTNGIARQQLVKAPMEITTDAAKLHRGLFYIGDNCLAAVGSYISGLSEITSDQMDYLVTHPSTKKVGDIENNSFPGGLYAGQTAHRDIEFVKFYTGENSNSGFRLEMYRQSYTLNSDNTIFGTVDHLFTKYKFKGAAGSPDRYLYADPQIRYYNSTTGDFGVNLSTALCSWNAQPLQWGQTGPAPTNHTIGFTGQFPNNTVPDAPLYVYVIPQ